MLEYYSKNNPGSSSGRTKDSGSFNGGSNPSPGEHTKNRAYALFFVCVFIGFQDSLWGLMSSLGWKFSGHFEGESPKQYSFLRSEVG